MTVLAFRQLIGQHHQPPEVSERLVVQIPRDAAALSLGLVGQLHSSVCKLPVRAKQASILTISPPHRQKRQRQQYG